ncbi:hypothetical protein Aduo_013220 [Ancylostoma duodenale]
MAELQVFKAKINNACTLIKTVEADIKRLDEPFTFPEGRSECEQYVRTETGALAHLLNALQNAVKMQEAQISAAINHIAGRHDQKERETLMTELNKHLEVESHQLELTAAQWQNKIQFRQHELREQSNVLHSTIPSTSNQSINGSEGATASIPERNERQIKIRRPMLEIPSFSGNFREFNSFWAVFESLIHNDYELSDVDKFLFLKQALKGRAAAALSCIPVTGDRYSTAVNILKKQFDRSANMADIIINEIERLQRALEDPRSCRETFEAINSRLIHLEQTGMKMNADRVWRRIILSKFPEFICTAVIQKETECEHPFDVTEIMTTIDTIISLRETTALTTETLFSKDNHRSYFPEPGINRPKWDEERNTPSRRKRMCLCGQSHSPHSCSKHTTPEARRAEVRRQRACWRCFAKNHHSKDCTMMGLCPRCNEGHHSSLCLSEMKRQDTGYLAFPRHSARNIQLPPTACTQQPPVNAVSHCYHHQGDNTNVQAVQNSQNGRQIPTLNRTATVRSQCVLQVATAMIFNEAEWDYQPVTLLLDSGAQKSFIKSEISEALKLGIIDSTSFTASGMGEIQEVFDSDEVQVTLKSLHNSMKLKKLPIHTKGKLTSTLSTAELSEADLNFISSSNITVAQQSLARTNVSPDVIIGQDLLSTIIDHNSPVLTLPSGLILTPTLFGYVISGTSPFTGKATAAETHLGALVLSTPMDDHRKTREIGENVDTAGFPCNEGKYKPKKNISNACRRTSHGSSLSNSAEKGPHCNIASELQPDRGSRMALLDLGKPAKKVSTIWNSDYLEFRGHHRLLEEYRNSTSRKREVLPAAMKAIGKKSSKKRKQATGAVKTPVTHEMMETFYARSSTKCVSKTHAITSTSLDATTGMKDSLPARQQRRRMSTPWLYRHWLFKQESQLNATRQARKCLRDL